MELKKRKLKTAGGPFTLIFLVQPPRCLFFSSRKQVRIQDRLEEKKIEGRRGGKKTRNIMHRLLLYIKHYTLYTMVHLIFIYIYNNYMGFRYVSVYKKSCYTGRFVCHSNAYTSVLCIEINGTQHSRLENSI